MSIYQEEQVMVEIIKCKSIKYDIAEFSVS